MIFRFLSNTKMKKLTLFLLIAFLPIFCYGQIEIKTKPFSFPFKRPNIAAEIYLFERIGLEYEFLQTYMNGVTSCEGCALFKGQKNRVSAKYYFITKESFQESFQVHISLYGGGKILKRYPSAKVVGQNQNLTWGEGNSYRLTQLMIGSVTGIKCTFGMKKSLMLELQIGFGKPFNSKFGNVKAGHNFKPPNHDAYAGFRVGMRFGDKPLFQKKKK